MHRHTLVEVFVAHERVGRLLLNRSQGFGQRHLAVQADTAGIERTLGTLRLQLSRESAPTAARTSAVVGASAAGSKSRASGPKLHQCRLRPPAACPRDHRRVVGPARPPGVPALSGAAAGSCTARRLAATSREVHIPDPSFPRKRGGTAEHAVNRASRACHTSDRLIVRGTRPACQKCRPATHRPRGNGPAVRFSRSVSIGRARPPAAGRDVAYACVWSSIHAELRIMRATGLPAGHPVRAGPASALARHGCSRPNRPPCSCNWTASVVEGTPVAWSDDRVLLLSRNGSLWQFAPQQAQDYRLISHHFRPYSQSEMRGQLLREYGDRFDVSGTGNYLVVHPAGERDRWARAVRGAVPVVRALLQRPRHASHGAGVPARGRRVPVATRVRRVRAADRWNRAPAGRRRILFRRRPIASCSTIVTHGQAADAELATERVHHHP